MIAHDIPDGPFVKVAMDIMSFKGRDYLVAVDYYSKFPELGLLENKTSECVIAQVKSISARLGIPEEIVADNQPFGSYAFPSLPRVGASNRWKGPTAFSVSSERHIYTIPNVETRESGLCTLNIIIWYHGRSGHRTQIVSMPCGCANHYTTDNASLRTIYRGQSAIKVNMLHVYMY